MMKILEMLSGNYFLMTLIVFAFNAAIYGTAFLCLRLKRALGIGADATEFDFGDFDLDD